MGMVTVTHRRVSEESMLRREPGTYLINQSTGDCCFLTEMLLTSLQLPFLALCHKKSLQVSGFHSGYHLEKLLQNTDALAPRDSDLAVLQCGLKIMVLNNWWTPGPSPPEWVLWNDCIRIHRVALPSCPVVKNPPANAGDTGSVPGLGRCHGATKALNHIY